MIKKEKIAISIDKHLLHKIDNKIDKLNFKNRSNVIENLVREWLKLKEDIAWLIIANDDSWNDDYYPLNIPKCLIEIDGITVLQKNIDNLKQAWIKNIYISVWFKKELVLEFLKNKWLLSEVKIIGSNILDKSGKVLKDSFLYKIYNKVVVMLWDNYNHNFNMLDFIYYHNTNNSKLSIVVKTIDSSQGYWNVKLEWNNIVKFVEKPKTKEDISFIINAWIYIINSDIFPDLNWNFKLETDFFPNYVSWNIVKAYFHNWKWFHIQDNKTLNLLK